MSRWTNRFADRWTNPDDYTPIYSHKGTTLPQELITMLNDMKTEAYESPEWHPAFEEYCETIFELDEDNLQVIQARIADRLEISRPAVSETIKRMRAEGLVEDGRGTIRLTEAGRSLGETIVRRHRLAERLLTDVLGLSWADAHTEAGKWEHVISPMVEEAMVRVLDGPTTCPHGNPIPGSGYETPDLVALDALPVGAEFMVQRIPEELEFEPGMLEFLEQAHMTPGSVGKLTAMSPNGTSTLEVAGRPVGLDSYTTSRILVTAASCDSNKMNRAQQNEQSTVNSDS